MGRIEKIKRNLITEANKRILGEQIFSKYIGRKLARIGKSGVLKNHNFLQYMKGLQSKKGGNYKKEGGTSAKRFIDFNENDDTILSVSGIGKTETEALAIVQKKSNNAPINFTLTRQLDNGDVEFLKFYIEKESEIKDKTKAEVN